MEDETAYLRRQAERFRSMARQMDAETRRRLMAMAAEYEPGLPGMRLTDLLAVRSRSDASDKIDAALKGNTRRFSSRMAIVSEVAVSIAIAPIHGKLRHRWRNAHVNDRWAKALMTACSWVSLSTIALHPQANRGR